MKKLCALLLAVLIFSACEESADTPSSSYVSDLLIEGRHVYDIGETFKGDDLTVYAVYNNGDAVYVEPDDEKLVMLTGAFDVAGPHVIHVIYQRFRSTYYVYVGTPDTGSGSGGGGSTGDSDTSTSGGGPGITINW
jgi:hypothetical protein